MTMHSTAGRRHKTSLAVLPVHAAQCIVAELPYRESLQRPMPPLPDHATVRHRNTVPAQQRHVASAALLYTAGDLPRPFLRGAKGRHAVCIICDHV